MKTLEGSSVPTEDVVWFAYTTSEEGFKEAKITSRLWYEAREKASRVLGASPLDIVCKRSEE